MICRKDRAHHQQQRGSLPPEIQSAIREKETAGRRKNRGLLPQEKQSVISGKDRAHHQQQRGSLPPEIQSAIRERETADRRKNRELLPQKKKRDKQVKDQQRKHASRHSADIQEVMNKFLGHIKDFPEYICTSCHRMLYKKSVTQVHTKLFVGVNAEMTEACCTGKTSPDGKEWICGSALRALSI